MQKKALIMSVIAATSVALILSIVLISKKSNNDLNELPIETMSAEFIYDTKDIRELIGITELNCKVKFQSARLPGGN